MLSAETLPGVWMREKTCCFTGHRTIPENRRTELAIRLQREIRRAVTDGFRYFLCGGAVGFDMLAGEGVVLEKRVTPEVELWLALPCRDQTLRWTRLSDLRAYQQLKGQAAWIGYAADFYNPTCMKERNRFMTEHAARCIAYYDGTIRSGTAQTVHLAEQNGVEVVNLYGQLRRKNQDEK